MEALARLTRQFFQYEHFLLNVEHRQEGIRDVFRVLSVIKRMRIYGIIVDYNTRKICFAALNTQ